MRWHMQSFMDKLNKVTIANINKHHQKTIILTFVVCAMVKRERILNSILCDVVNIFLQCKFSCIHTYYMHHYVYKCDILHWNKTFSWKTPIVRQLKPKCHSTVNVQLRKYDTCLRNHACLKKREEAILCMLGFERGFVSSWVWSMEVWQ